MTKLPADQETRDRALSPRESFHLEAPAGSGKTSVLLARFLTLLAQVEAPEEILALTFTRKAAGELRTRVMQLLWRQRDPGLEAHPWERRLAELAEQVLRHYDRMGRAIPEILAPERLPLMTFHSFCAQLLRLAPQDAGVPLEFQLLEENEARRLRQEALEELRRRLSARPSHDPVRQALVRRLVRLNNDWSRLARELDGLLARRDILGDFLALAKASREPQEYLQLLEARFHLALLPVLQGLAAGLKASELGRRWPEFRAALRGSDMGEGLPEAIPGDTPQDLEAWHAMARVLLTRGGEPRKQLTVKQGFPAGLHQGPWAGLIQQLPGAVGRGLKQCRDLSPQGASPAEAAALQDLVILLGEALEVFSQRCAQQGVLDFVALEQATLNLLKTEDPSDLLLRLDWRLKHLLVDEFQDTSQNQMDLLCRLMTGWQAGESRSLMVVGDPKQSIYGWRQAKPQLFQESRRGLPCASGEPLPLASLMLTTNFRATRTLISWANEVFGATIMSAGVAGAAFHRATPRPLAPEGPAPHLAVFSGDDNPGARQLEARWLAQQVAAALPTLPTDEKIGILLFARTHLPLYLQALNDAGLTVRVKEGLKLADSRVVAHLHNLALALTRPQDEVAWAGVLRGPWAPLPLHLLAQAAQAPGELWPEKLRHLAETGDCPRELARLGLTLTAALGQVGRRPLADILEDWLTENEAWEGLAAWEGAPGVANARTYLELLAASDSGLPEATFQATDFNLQEAFQPPDPRAQDSPVEVLTVHGAKGLEFHQVFLPFLDWQPLRNEDKTPPFLLEEIPGQRLSGLALARPYIQEKQSSLYLLLKDLKNRRVLDEARRVFYVAVTRAKHRLVLSGLIKPGSRGDWSAPEESPLGWLRQHYRGILPPPGDTTSWAGPEIAVEFPTEAPLLLSPGRQIEKIPAPLEFHPEPAPYQLSFPSQLAAMDREDEMGTGEAGAGLTELPRLRGEIIHRLLDTRAKGGALPERAALAAALRQGGIEPPAAEKLSLEITAELKACLQDPFLGPLLRPDLPDAGSEWLLEDWASPDTIRRGKIDRLAFHGGHWWLLDYKTSRPGKTEDWEEFIRGEAEKYRPQLLAYREMAARLKRVPREKIRPLLYFTACQRAVEIL